MRSKLEVISTNWHWHKKFTPERSVNNEPRDPIKLSQKHSLENKP
jgi:hypothetical protein